MCILKINVKNDLRFLPLPKHIVSLNCFLWSPQNCWNKINSGTTHKQNNVYNPFAPSTPFMALCEINFHKTNDIRGCFFCLFVARDSELWNRIEKDCGRSIMRTEMSKLFVWFGVFMKSALFFVESFNLFQQNVSDTRRKWLLT